eukprot:4372902-Pyramimonas_sp.AAC.1
MKTREPTLAELAGARWTVAFPLRAAARPFAVDWVGRCEGSGRWPGLENALANPTACCARHASHV